MVVYDDSSDIPEDILKLMESAGFPHARAPGLTSFEKLSAGLAWCIDACNDSTRVDSLLYEDDASLWGKIKIGESIESALQAMGCPHPLLAHQIQGLHFPAVLSVLKWLMMRRSEKQARQRAIEQERGGELAVLRRELAQRQALHTALLHRLEQCQLTGTTVPREDQPRCRAVPSRQSLAAAAVREVRHGIASCRQRVCEAGGEAALPMALSLIQHVESLKQQEVAFKSSCRSAVAAMDAHLHTLAEETRVGPTAASQAAMLTASRAWSAHRQALADVAKRLAVLRRQLATHPTSAELLQYERRFMELYQHVQDKHSDTQNYFAAHNAVAHTLQLTTKEESLLESIREQFAAAVPAARKVKVLDSMEVLSSGVKQSLGRASAKYTDQKQQLQQLQQKQALLLSKQRAYFDAIKELQEECARGEKLVLMLG